MIHHTTSLHVAGLPWRRVLAAAVALTLTLAACSGGEQAAETSGEPDQVTYLTSFGNLGRDAYPYVAAAQGFFTDANLDVEIQPGVGANNLALLAGGQAQFAAIDMSALIVNIGRGNTGYTALAAVHQLAPQALMTTDPDITGPQDLPGKTVALVPGAVGDLLFPAYAAQVRLNPDEVDIVDADPASLPSLLVAGTVDAIDQFEMGLPLIEAAVGDRQVMVLSYSEHLPDLYGIVLITTTELAVQQPELVERFRDALFRGLEYSIDNPAEAGAILAEVDEAIDSEVAAAELEIMESYVRQAGVPLGAIDEVRVAQTIALLESTGRIPAGLTAAEIVDLDLAITTES